MSTTINSACWPFAVCAITHRSILFAVALAPPCPVAREEPFAANAAIPAATKNNEQNMRRNEDGVNVVSGGEDTAATTSLISLQMATPMSFGELPNTQSRSEYELVFEPLAVCRSIVRRKVEQVRSV